MSSSGQIVNLVNPTNAQDAATRSYVDTKTTDMATNATVSAATSGMATTTHVSSEITTALGSNGAGYGENRPTVQRGDTDSAEQYLTFFNDTDFPSSDGSTKRALMRCDGNLYYKPSTKTLAVSRIYLDKLVGPSNLEFQTVSSVAMSINSSGHVGIGTTAPSYPLHVNARGVNVNTGNYRVESGGAFSTGPASRPVVRL